MVSVTQNQSLRGRTEKQVFFSTDLRTLTVSSGIHQQTPFVLITRQSLNLTKFLEDCFVATLLAMTDSYLEVPVKLCTEDIYVDIITTG